MKLGAFSVSLSVQNMAASRAFYDKLGFTMFGGDGEAWTIMANGPVVIGLFSGMFEGNILTFNPGWTGLGEPVAEFTDVRQLSQELQAVGIDCQADTTAETVSGPASFSIVDPDGNVILIDQHV